MTEPCMCGALDCRFCGPLQGSFKCEAHQKLACSDCEDGEESTSFDPDDEPPGWDPYEPEDEDE